MNTTVKGLPPGEVLKAFPWARARPFVDMRQPVPGAPLAQGAADATGNLTLDLPENTELLLQRPSGRGLHVLNATTVVTSL